MPAREKVILIRRLPVEAAADGIAAASSSSGARPPGCRTPQHIPAMTAASRGAPHAWSTT